MRSLWGRAKQYAEKMTRKRLTGEMGIPGDLITSGVSVPRYHPELQGAEWFRKVDEMLLASSQAAVVELCVALPIVTAEWRLEGGDSKLREQVETSLFGSAGMSTTWREVLYNACAAALYGTAAFEIIWKETPEGFLIRRLSDRDPASLTEYRDGPDGGLEMVVQEGQDPATEQPVTIEIPVEKMLLFPYRLRRRQYHGRSILRPAYRHYEAIRMLCTFADIGLDHSLIGVPIGKAPPGAPQDKIDFMLDLLGSIRRHESSGLVLPAGWDLITTPMGGSDSVGFLDYIQWHEGAMLRAALCNFMQLGSLKTGTTEMAGDLMDFSLMAWSALADMIAGVFNRHLIRRHCDYNAGHPLKEEAYPELVYQPLQELFGNRQAAGEYLGDLASGGEVPGDATDRLAAVRDGLGLRAASGAGNAALTPPARSMAARAFAEEDVVAAVARVKADKASQRSDWQATMALRLEALLRSLLRQVDLAGGDPVRLAVVAPPAGEVAVLADGIARWIGAARAVGAARFAEESGNPAGALADPEPTPKEIAKARVLAEHLAEAARFAVVGAALRGDDLEALATEYSEAVGVRLRQDLSGAAQETVAELNGILAGTTRGGGLP